ncbi:Dynein regulatory complex subunit 5 [Eumeta japonica]|uniref:Dynein regulatory complex subunit 5 n=1 Tax=Eumeta variegata TaxID=151549 RepID=A0A4C1YKP0_EUMVA|nr:Dynein regulatory complex subunit 5 [Eumeta japonica]
MKVPYAVSENSRIAYQCSSAMRDSGGERHRKVHAEELDWDKRSPASLRYYALLSLSRVLHRINPLDRILKQDIDMIMDLYPVDIPLKFSVPFIQVEHYWKRAFEMKFPSKKELAVSYWKGKYLATYLQEYMETIKPDVFLEDEARLTSRLVSPYVYQLRLSQLQIVRQPLPEVCFENEIVDTCPYSVQLACDHIPLKPIVELLYNLEELSLIFGVNSSLENYEERLFEFSVADIDSLCMGLKNLHHIRVLRINRSNLDCVKVKVLLQHLLKKDSIEELDFSHCKIGNHGMKALGGFLYMHTNLKVLRISNNRFDEEGVRGIAYALQSKPAAPIELLDFSLNIMSLECATMFAAAFVRCKEKPQTLIVNACGLYGASAEKMAGILSLNRGLKRLDIAGNDLSGEAEKTLITALEQNRNILKINLLLTKISTETQQKVNELLERNRHLVGVERAPSAEIPLLYLNEPEYLVWEYNPNNPKHVPGRYPARVAEYGAVRCRGVRQVPIKLAKCVSGRVQCRDP